MEANCSVRKKIRVLVVDDSMFFRKMIMDHLSKDDRIEVIGYAINTMDAKDKILKLKPDVVTMDVEMPGETGIEFVKKFVPVYLIPIILVSSLNISIFDALSAGAVDFVRKPDMSSMNTQSFFRELITKVYIASIAKIKPKRTEVSSLSVKKDMRDQKEDQQRNHLARNTRSKMPLLTKAGSSKFSTVIAIGASTGGTDAILEVVKDLPENTPPILVTQHMPKGFTEMYAQRLDKICPMTVREAKDGDRLLQGQILIAPGDYQMRVVKKNGEYFVECKQTEKVSGHRPSVDVLFHSIAENVTEHTIGVILTGMGRDGAKGLLEMRKKGAYTIGQDKESCVVYGMPMVAYELGAVMKQAPCEGIAALIREKIR